MDLTFLHDYYGLALFVLRLFIGIIFLAHGIKKFGTWKAPASGMTNIMRFLSIAETAGGLGLIFGVLSQWAAFGLMLVMLGAMYFKIFKWNRTFTQDGGWELDFILLGSCFLIFIMGAGAYTL